MKTLSVLLFLFLFLTFSGYGFSNNIPQVSIEEGLKDIYNVKLEEAENKFHSYQVLYPEDIKGYFFETMVYFYRAASLRDENSFNKYIDLTDKVIDKCDDLLDKNEDDVDALYFKGATHSYRSIIMLYLNKTLLKAADNGSKGYRMLKNIVTNHPDYYDAYMGYALFKIAIGYIPEKYKWFLSLIGIDGSIRDGIKLLRIASDKAKYNRTDSKAFLTVFLIREKEEKNTESLDIVSGLVSEYPESPIIRLAYGGFLVQIFKLDEALIQINKALELNTNSLQNEVKKVIYSLSGIIYFRKNDFRNAIVNFEEYFKYLIDEDRYNMTSYLLGESYEMMGRRDIALEKYKAARNKYIDERDGEPEKFYFRYSNERILSPINEFDSLLIIAVNKREEGLFDESLDIFNQISDNNWLEKNNNDDVSAKYYYELGFLYNFRNDTGKAANCFNKCVNLKPSKETWIIPHSYFEMGKIYYRNGNKELSEKMFNKIYEYKDYDFNSLLEMRLRNFPVK